jgi:hypothetical protein
MSLLNHDARWAEWPCPKLSPRMGKRVPIVEARRPGFQLDPPSSGLLLVAAPGAGYALAYAHELGWSMWFGIPNDLIAPQLGTVLAATAALLLFVAVIAMFVFFYMLIRPSVPISQAESLLVGTLAFVAVLVLLASVGDPSQDQNAWAGLVILILAFVGAVVFRSGVLQDQLRGEAQQMRDLLARVRSFWVFISVAVVASLVFGFSLGGFQARTQTSFLVSDTPTPAVELAIYGDTVVLAPFDQTKHVVQPEFVLVKIGSAPMHLRSMKVGPLKSSPKTP